MKEKLSKRVAKNTGLLLFLLLTIELIARLNMKLSLLNWSAFRIVISSIIISLTLGLLLAFCQKKLVKNILMTILSFGLTAYVWIEVNLYHYLGFYMGVGNAEQGARTVDYIIDYLKAVHLNTYLMFLPFILIMLFIWWFEKKLRIKFLNKTIFFDLDKEKNKSRLITGIVSILIIVLFSIGYYSTLKLSFMQNKLQSIKNNDLILITDKSNLSVSQFGVLVYGLCDLIVGVFEIETVPNFTNINYENNSEKTATNYNRYLDDSAWNYIIENEKSNTYNNINKYFINREITSKNEYTGIFENYNLIMILMESTNNIVINEKEFPTIYKLYSEGISFRNNYTPRNNCSTGNNEMTALTGLFTINNTCTYNTYKNNKYFQSVFNVFKKTGYHTSSYHDFAEFYYDRRTSHPNMGSMKYYNANALGIEWTSVYREWPSDVEMFTKAQQYYMDQDLFMAFFATVSPHQPYTESSTLGDKYLNELTEYEYSKTVKRYMSKLKEMDHALKLLLEQLEASGKLDNTVIALFADHYPYGLTSGQIKSVLNYNINLNNEIDRTPMIIYNSKLKPVEITKYTTIIDLLPTLLNLFNLNYDPRYYFGHDVFSEYDDHAIFADGSWQDSKGYYSATSGKFTPIDEAITYTTEELININNNIEAMQKMSAIAIKNNYFNYLSNQFINYENNHKAESGSGNMIEGNNNEQSSNS